MDSILVSIKKMLGIEQEYTHFDSDIIIYTNTALMSLNQIGVGPDTGFVISGETETWSDLFGDRIDLEGVKSCVYLKVRLVFDPPSNSFVLDAIERQIKELEFRIMTQVENTAQEGV